MSSPRNRRHQRTQGNTTHNTKGKPLHSTLIGPWPAAAGAACSCTAMWCETTRLYFSQETPVLLTLCLALGRASGSPFARNQETHKPEQNPGHLSRSSFRSASLRFTTTTTPYGHLVPTELCPTGPVVFCGSASHSLPLFVCNTITHRRWCFASCLTTKTHHR